MRDNKVQFLPIQWRANFRLDADEEKRRENEGLDNDFTLSGKPRNTLSIMHDYPTNISGL